MFIARVSRGRCIREIVIYCFLAPLLYSILWFCTFGGIGLRQSRQALELEKLGTDYYNNSAQFQSSQSEFCYDVPQGSVSVDVNGTSTEIFTNTML